MFTKSTEISTVINDPIFQSWGKLIFPIHSHYMSGHTLGDLQLTYYNCIDPDKTVEICNYFKQHASNGETVFYHIYSAEHMNRDPTKRNTGIFFFRGNPGQEFAVCNAGGAFAYVGAMHDSFPHAIELSKMGFNAFALIYRPDWQLACEDLAQAITFIFEHQSELQVGTSCYSLWGGSAGGRMAAYLGTNGPAYYGGATLPRAGACVIQYTGHTDVSPNDPPTYSCVGTSDWIANWNTMQQRLARLSKMGIDTEFHKYQGLPHGFGLGTGTCAEGWIKDAVNFWVKQINKRKSNA